MAAGKLHFSFCEAILININFANVNSFANETFALVLHVGFVYCVHIYSFVYRHTEKILQPSLKIMLL